ncbi:MAG: ECF-type sigma factor [Vicinamibacterales bacterium]
MSDVPPSEATRLLRAVRAGAATRDDVTPRLVALMYPELRALAARLMRGERSGHTLQPTAVVNEAFPVPMPPCPSSKRIRYGPTVAGQSVVQPRRQSADADRRGVQHPCPTRSDGGDAHVRAGPSRSRRSERARPGVSGATSRGSEGPL